jgi:hypothetical protein
MTKKKIIKSTAGRKPITPGEKSVTINCRLSLSQKTKFFLIGGAKWLRGQIDSATRKKT